MADFQPHVKGEEREGDAHAVAHECVEEVGETHAVHETKYQRQHILVGDFFLLTPFFGAQQIAHARQKNGHWNEQFDPVGIADDDLKGRKRQRDRMPDGKGSDEYQYLFPFGEFVYRAEGEDEQDMVKALYV